VSITSGSDSFGQQRYSIGGNHIAANAPNQYKAVIVRVNGDCEFSSNQCVNDNSANNRDSDVEIIADVIIAGNNRVEGNTNEAQISMALTASTNPNKDGNATVLGNICSSGITLNGPNLPPPWGPFNIKA
jgi:spore coat polysaccharide biosynthesis protein SpsF (cytidylyltransferase family)